MTRFLGVADVIAIHDRRSGSVPLDRGRLEAAVGQPRLELAGGYVYESLFLQAAVLLHRTAMAHAFADGNTRTAWVAAVVFLDLNGVRLRADLTQTEVVEFVVSVVVEHLDQDAIALWLEAAADSDQPTGMRGR